MRDLLRLTGQSTVRSAAIAGLLAALLLQSIDVAAAQTERSDASQIRVFRLIGERLSLMKPVAHWKYLRDGEIEDLAREAVVLDAAVADALEVGIDGDSVRPFFQAQIDAAKDVQQCWFARWQAGEGLPEGEPPDLVAEIRPQLLDIGSGLLAALIQALSTEGGFDGGSAVAFEDAVDIDCLSDGRRAEIFRHLGTVTVE